MKVLNEKYEILDILGKGGMSTVYLAKDIHLNKLWAIKEVQKKGEFYINTLRWEADIILQFDHIAFPRIVDIIETSQTICLVMDYIEGKSLNKVGIQNEKTSLNWTIQIANALSYLHNQNPPIIYRDMKPSNVMITKQGMIKIIDFGTARTFKTNQTQDTFVLGTRGYAPPEQYTMQTDARSDIYALGMTLYFMLTGKSPQNFSIEKDHISKDVKEIIKKCVALQPDQRYQTCQQLLEDLKHPEQVRRDWKKVQKLKYTGYFLFGFFIFLRIYNFYLFNQEYENLIHISEASSYQEKIKRYTKAIQHSPKKQIAYEKLLETFEEDGKFDQKENEIFLSLYNENHQQIQHVESLNYHAGMMYLNYYPASFLTRITKAYSFFQENASIEKEYSEKKQSIQYYWICDFYKKYILESVYVDEASRQDYENIMRWMEKTLQENKQENVYDQLMYLRTALLFLLDQAEAMQQVQIDQHTIQKNMDCIYRQVQALHPRKSSNKKLQTEIIQIYERGNIYD